MSSVILKLILKVRGKHGHQSFYGMTYISPMTKMYMILMDLAALFNNPGKINTSRDQHQTPLIFRFKNGRFLQAKYRVDKMADLLNSRKNHEIPTLITVYNEKGLGKDFNIDKTIGEIISFFTGSEVVDLDTGLDIIEYTHYIDLKPIILNPISKRVILEAPKQ